MTWRHRLNLAASVLATLLLLTGAANRGEEKAPDRAGEIVASVLKAYGGARAVGKVVSVTARGRITEFLSGKTGEYRRYFQRPKKLRVEVMPEQGGEIRILDGDQGWQSSEGEFVLASQLELQSMLYQYSYLNLPMALAKENYPVKYGGRQRGGGLATYLLLVEPKKAPRLGILIDAKTRLIIRVDASFAVGTGTGELSTVYGDFRPVAGVQFPHKLTSFAGGIKLSEIVLDEIEVNREIPSELFAPEGELRSLP
jgi:outer membrane lipoprotein-sorting protein